MLINPLCYLFEYQIPHFIWSHWLLAQIIYHLHDMTCPDLICFNIKEGYRPIWTYKYEIIF